MRKTLDELLEDIAVHGPAQWENIVGPVGWYAVSTPDGIIAYFGDEAMAFAFRLTLINAVLNPIGLNPIEGDEMTTATEPMDVCIECGIDVPDGAGCAGYNDTSDRVAYCSDDAVKLGAFADESGYVTLGNQSKSPMV